METTKRRRRRRRKINISRLLLTSIVVILIIAFGVSIKTIVSLHMERSQLKKTNAEMMLQKQKLEKELKRVDDLNYIEEQARKQLNMIKPGEILFLQGKEQKKDKDK